MANIDYIVVGLGNPENKYELTRHNIGFRAVDFISEKLGINLNVKKFNALCQISEAFNKKILFLKPQTYMNLSGNAVVSAMKFYKIPPERTILIFDDISFEVGKIKLRKKGSHGGQNGVKNIINLAGNNNFPRIKIGIGTKPNNSWDLADWVLSKFSKEENKILETIFEKVYSCLEIMITKDIDVAMNLYN